MRFDRAIRDVGDVMRKQDSLAANIEAVRRFEDLHADAATGARTQALEVRVVLAEDPRHGHLLVFKRIERERRAEVAGVEHQANSSCLELLDELGDRGNAIMAI